MVMALSTGKREFNLVFSLPRSSFVLQPHLNSFVYLVPLFKSPSWKPYLKYAIGVVVMAKASQASFPFQPCGHAELICIFQFPTYNHYSSFVLFSFFPRDDNKEDIFVHQVSRLTSLHTCKNFFASLCVNYCTLKHTNRFEGVFNLRLFKQDLKLMNFRKITTRGSLQPFFASSFIFALLSSVSSLHWHLFLTFQGCTHPATILFHTPLVISLFLLNGSTSLSVMFGV